MKAVSRALLPALLLGAALSAGCGDGGPRTLPFPSLDARAPFPELVEQRTEGTAPGAPSRTSFADRLAPASAKPAGGGTEEEPRRRRVPLGSQLAGEIPSDPAWSWQQAGDGITLIACRPDGGRPAALIYAETFPSRMQIAPSEEIQRFQLTVNPEGNGRRLTPSAAGGVFKDGLVRQVSRETGTAGAETARLLQLLTTRTAGAGIGFQPARGSFTGWRWVGENGQDVTVRLARFTGTWEPRASLPAGLGQRLEALQRIPDLAPAVERLGSRLPESGPSSEGVSAYLLVGSATDDTEQAGAHLALLWQHSSGATCVEGLSAFLSSLSTGGAPASGQPGLAEDQASDLAEAAGLDLLPADALVPLDALRASREPAKEPGKP